MKSVTRTSFGEPDSQTEISSNPAAGFFLTQEHTSPRLNALPFSEFRNAERELLYVSSCPMDETKNPRREAPRSCVFRPPLPELVQKNSRLPPVLSGLQVV